VPPTGYQATIENRPNNRKDGDLDVQWSPGMTRLLRLWRLGGNDLRLLWFALRHPERPMWLIPAAVLLALYAIEPLNFAIPIIGVVDEFILLPLALHFMLTFLPAGIRAGFGPRVTVLP
jgi:uncharacterized membrane protein YkvA (DUF1232 family)